jgi:hypothetical protein
VNEVGEIKVSVPDEKEERFRKAAMKAFGHERGSISKAAEEAMEEWTEKRLEEDINLSGGLGDFLRSKAVETDKPAAELQKEMGEAYEDEVLD